MRSELVHQELATLFLSAIHLRKSIKSILNASLRTLNLGSCGVCGYSFCVLCFRAYHGVDDCKFKSGKKVWIARYKLRGQVFFIAVDKQRIIEEWNKADENGRVEMAKRFGGVKNLQVS